MVDAGEDHQDRNVQRREEVEGSIEAVQQLEDRSRPVRGRRSRKCELQRHHEKRPRRDQDRHRHPATEHEQFLRRLAQEWSTDEEEVERHVGND
jgi:hypothetical protein